jgi:cytoskeletal protein RodZ
VGAEDSDAPIPELVRLGERLASARRELGLSLEEVASRLRLGTEQLVALEAGDHTQLPEAVFVVAQAKRVAGVLRIDISQQISDLQDSRMMRKPGRSSLPSTPRRPVTAAASPSPRGGAPSSPRRSLGGLLLILLAGGALGLTVVAVLQRRLPSLANWRLPIPRTEPAPGASPPPATAPAPPAPTPAADVAPDQLLLKSGEPSWLEVRDASGGTLFRGTFSGEKRFPLGSGLRVLAGRPDLVTAAVGGSEARPLGPIDQVVWRSFKPSPVSP